MNRSNSSISTILPDYILSHLPSVPWPVGPFAWLSSLSLFFVYSPARPDLVPPDSLRLPNFPLYDSMSLLAYSSVVSARARSSIDLNGRVVLGTFKRILPSLGIDFETESFGELVLGVHQFGPSLGQAEEGGGAIVRARGDASTIRVHPSRRFFLWALGGMEAMLTVGSWATHLPTT